MKKPLATAAALAGGILLSLFFCYVFFPSSAVRDAVSSFLGSRGYRFTATSFGKTVLPGFRARGVVLSDDRGALLKVDDLVVSLEMLPLFRGRATVDVDARIGPGRFHAALSSRGSGSVAAEGIRLEDVPFFRTAADASISGTLTVKGELAAAKGFLQAEAKGAEIKDVKIGGIPLPSAKYDRIQAMIRVDGNRGRLETFNMQGEGLFARLSGQVTIAAPPGASPLDLTLELMPRSDFLEQQKLVFLLLAKYSDTPGHYKIPVKGLLAKPAVL